MSGIFKREDLLEITGGKASMNTNHRKGPRKGKRYISVEVKLYFVEGKEPESIHGWSDRITMAVYDVLECCGGLLVEESQPAHHEQEDRS